VDGDQQQFGSERLCDCLAEHNGIAPVRVAVDSDGDA
jgi:hypothetical protein